MSAHARLGGSKAERWTECPGSVSLAHDLPDPPGSEYAAEGTAAHELNELLFNDTGEALPESIEVEIAWDPDTGEASQWMEVEVTEEMIRFGQEYVRLCLEKAEDHPFWVESQVDLEVLAQRHPALTNEPMFGTVDFATFRPEGYDEDGVRTGVLEIVDYKYGKGIIVDVRENLQLIYYAIGMVIKLQELLDMRVRPHTIITTIYQPRIEHSEGLVRSHTYTWDELRGHSKRLLDAAARTQEPDAPLAVGAHCKFCPAKGICPAQQELAVAVARDNFSVVVADDGKLPVGQEEDEMIRFILEYGDLIVDRVKTVREKVREHLEKGGVFEGYKLIPGRRNREWKDEEAAKIFLKRKLGAQVATPKKLLSPAQAEKALKLKEGRLTQGFHERVKIVPGRPQLVPESHGAPALITEATAESEFTVEEGDNNDEGI